MDPANQSHSAYSGGGAEKLDWYLCRRQIDIFFKILKSDCKWVSKPRRLMMEEVDNNMGYTVVNADISYTHGPLTIAGRLNNITDNKYSRSLHLRLSYPAISHLAPHRNGTSW